MDSVEDQLKACLYLTEEARKMGCDEARLIWAKDVVFDPRVTLKCRQNICNHYGRNFMCPPLIPTSEEFRQSASKFKVALIVQKEREMSPESTMEDREKWFRRIVLDIRQILVSLERIAFEQGFVFSTALGGGECKLCKICGKQLGAESCSKPNEARPSMEAAGIDVIATCRKAGFPDFFQKERLAVTGMLYII